MSTFLDRCEPRPQVHQGRTLYFVAGNTTQFRIVVVESGTGQARGPAERPMRLLDAHSPKWILSCGFAGSLVPHIRVGDVVVADSIVDGQGQTGVDDSTLDSPPTRNRESTSGGCSPTT